MTIQGAIAELQNLLNANDVPFYYKGGIEKVIETIQMELSDRKTEPFDKDINVRSKDEPQTMYYPQVDGITPSVIVKDEPQISPSDCKTCKHDLWSTPRTCGKCFRQEDGKPSMYEPKDEPQTIKVGMATDSVTGKVLGITADTDCAWK